MSKCKESPCKVEPEVITELADNAMKTGLEYVAEQSGITETAMQDLRRAMKNPERPTGDVISGDDDKRGFKNIEGFIEGYDKIEYLYSLHIIDDNDELKNKMYKRDTDISKIVFTDTDSRPYNRYICQYFSEETISDICKNVMKDYNDHYNIFKTNLDGYTSLYEYQMYLGGIINEKLNFLDKIKNKINTYKQNNFMDNRKNSYLSSNLEFYKNIHFYIFILYYTIFIAFLIFSNFIKDKLYENKYVMIYVVAILIIPFILRYILLNIYNLYTNYIERNYLKLDEISYKYLVEETYHQKKNEKDQEQLNNYYETRNS
tara:strand:- start:4259 stop:5209 length:951 start_codon:yes stop_codon:yes gene_type:complete